MLGHFNPQKPKNGAFPSAPNRWDFVLLPLVLAVVAVLCFAASQMSRPFNVGEAAPISLDPVWLPYYLLRTILRMFCAMFFSLIFSLIFATMAAKYRAAEKVLIPLLDILQSVPILGFQAIAVAPFIALFPGNIFGVECAAIFAIFTSQAWNMAFSLYQSIRSVPEELKEASAVFRLSGWQKFWRMELPFALPGLLWNMMMSMSGGWFFLVAAEAISVANQDIRLPGIGSYIATAIDQKNGAAILWAIVAMLAGIILYDQLFFRPLLAWADKFRFEENISGNIAQQSWLLDLIRRSRMAQAALARLAIWPHRAVSWFPASEPKPDKKKPSRQGIIWTRLWDIFLLLASFAALATLAVFVHQEVGWTEVAHVAGLGFLTLGRVLILIALASVFWVPVAVWIGLRPRYSQRVQAIAQFLAAFPVNLLFPLVVYLLVEWRLNPDVWLSPLMIFGTQWYILFNVVAGAGGIPTELRLAADNLGLKGWLRWKRVYLPAIFPSFITGAITACGGSWNASIVAEYVTWGDTTLSAAGLGSYIKIMTDAGDFHRIALGIGIMCIFVMLLNRFFWHKLYIMADKHGLEG